MIIIGNTFTIFVFWNQRSGIKRTYFLLINLAIADLLVGITELTVLGAFKFEVMLESDTLLIESLSFTYTANGRRQIQVENFSKEKTSR